MNKNNFSKSGLFMLGLVLLLASILFIISSNISESQDNRAKAARKPDKEIQPTVISTGETNFSPKVVKGPRGYYSVWVQDHNIAFANSSNGSDWTQPKILHPISDRQQLVPQIEICNRYIYVTYSQGNDAYFTYSKNNGENWSHPVRVGGNDNPVIGNAYIQTDKKCDLYAIGPIEYMKNPYIFKTEDQGMTWSEPLEMGFRLKSSQFLIIDEIFHLAWPSGDSVKYAKSTDFGRTWIEESIPFTNTLYGYEVRSLKIDSGLPVVTVLDHANSGGNVHMSSKQSDGTWSAFKVIGVVDIITKNYDFDINSRRWYIAQVNWDGDLIISVSENKGAEWLPLKVYDNAFYHSLDLFVNEFEVLLEHIDNNQIMFSMTPEILSKPKN